MTNNEHESKKSPGLDERGIDERLTQPVIGLTSDDRDLLISRVIDGNASQEDWANFRSLAAHEPAIWSELAQTQSTHESLMSQMNQAMAVADRVSLPGGLMDDGPMRSRMEMVSRWGGWAAAAAILLVWFFGQPMNALKTHNPTSLDQTGDQPVVAGLPGQGLGEMGSKLLLDQAPPEDAFDQYISAGKSAGRVVGEMPEQVVIETRPMPDGTIEVLYLRQVIERRVIDHAYREVRNEAGGTIPVPVKIVPRGNYSF